MVLLLILELRRQCVHFRFSSSNAGNSAGEVVPAVDNPGVPSPLQTARIWAQTGLEKEGDGELQCQVEGGGEGGAVFRWGSVAVCDDRDDVVLVLCFPVVLTELSGDERGGAAVFAR